MQFVKLAAAEMPAANRLDTRFRVSAAANFAKEFLPRVTGVDIGGVSKMKIIGLGEFAVSQSEQITVSIEKSQAPYSAKASDIFNGSWNHKPEPGGPDDLTATGTFACPANSGDETSFGVVFNFVPSPTADGSTGDFYRVSISGSNGGESPQLIFGPGFTTRTYQFEVQ